MEKVWVSVRHGLKRQLCLWTVAEAAKSQTLPSFSVTDLCHSNMRRGRGAESPTHSSTETVPHAFHYPAPSHEKLIQTQPPRPWAHPPGSALYPFWGALGRGGAAPSKAENCLCEGPEGSCREAPSGYRIMKHTGNLVATLESL